jgi:hypothetical protein
MLSVAEAQNQPNSALSMSTAYLARLCRIALVAGNEFPDAWEVRLLAASDRYGILDTEPKLAFAENTLLASESSNGILLCQNDFAI